MAHLVFCPVCHSGEFENESEPCWDVEGRETVPTHPERIVNAKKLLEDTHAS